MHLFSQNLTALTEAARVDTVKISQPEQLFRLIASGDNSDSAILLAARPNIVQPAIARLRLNDVSARLAPGSSVQVYLSDGTGTKRAFVGNVSFFSPFAHRRGGHQASRDFAYDVSKPMQDLFAANVAPDTINVLFVASSGLTGEQDVASKARYRKAGLQMRSVVLEIETRAEVMNFQ